MGEKQHVEVENCGGRMHWVKATTPDGRDNYINLAAVPTMLPATEATILFLGGIMTGRDGKVQYATTAVRETPDELFALPVIPVGEVPETVAAPAPKPATVATVEAMKPDRKKKAKA